MAIDVRHLPKGRKRAKSGASARSGEIHLPAIKTAWKNVNNVTSSAFVAMWQQRVSYFYSRYADAN